MRILAFDQASVITGWALFVDGCLVDSGEINLKKIKDTDERHRQMDISLANLMESKQPDLVAIEDIYLSGRIANMQTVMRISFSRGLIVGWCHIHNIPVERSLPTTWRKVLGFAQGKNVGRKEIKQQALDYVKKNFDMEITHDDQADAICIGHAAVLKYERSLSE